jgi:hypothetical protein
MIVNVFDERAPGKHEAAPLEKGLNTVVVKITKNMTMEQVVSKIKKEVEAAGGGPESISMMRFFGHGNAGIMEFGKVFRYWTVESFKDLAGYMDPNGKGLELHGCYTGSAVYVRGQDCSKPGRFYPQTEQPGKVGLGFELLLALSGVLKVPVTGGVNCQYGDPAHKLEGPTITVSPDGITMRNVPIDQYDDRGTSPGKADSTPSQPQSEVNLRPDLLERIKILDVDVDEELVGDLQNQHTSTLPDLSQRIEILDVDLDEQPQINVQNQHASTLPDLSERIELLEDVDLDVEPGVDWRHQQPDPLHDVFEDFDRPNEVSWQHQQPPTTPNPLSNAFEDFDRPNQVSWQHQQPFQQPFQQSSPPQGIEPPQVDWRPQQPSNQSKWMKR